MAEEQNTFTVDTTPQTETMTDNLTPEEQDSLAVGEQLAAEQETLLAGKYKSAEELEKAYKELESKLGEKEEAEQAEPEPDSDSDSDSSLSDNASIITAASDEYYANGNKLSEETLEKFRGMSSEDLVNAYLEVTNSPEWTAQPGSEVEDVSEAQINEVKNAAGGEQQYREMVEWAGKNLDAKAITAFDQVINTGSIEAIKFAVSGLRAEYLNAVGYDGQMIQGKAPQTTKDVFRSQAELVAAMSDKRYDNDPAYRQDVIQKLERSDNLEF